MELHSFDNKKEHIFDEYRNRIDGRETFESRMNVARHFGYTTQRSFSEFIDNSILIRN